MNKSLYRVVFNRARGIRMVVQETAASDGKGTNKATSGPGAPARAAATVVLFGALVALPGQAQVVGAPNVPGNLRPTVLVAPNGVPLINIQSPSAAGVSRNVYNQLSVGPNGAIFNNSRTNVQTQLGGFVQGNPHLARGPARIILNEVNGGNVSQLRGYMEVAGQRAEIIIANPAGINVDGAGFINASRATLTTGVPQMNAFGGLDSFLVRGGTITINGAGLDVSKTDYAAILARAVEANAGIWASELKVVTGANQVSADHNQISATTGTGAAHTFALDVAVLGGMYAGKIVLIGTEAGLGVRNAGTIQAAPGTPARAGAGQLVVTTAGRLENIGTMQGTADVNIAASGLANSGRISSGGNLKVTTQDHLANSLNGKGGTLEGARIEMASAAGDIDNRGGLIRQTSSAGLALGAPALSNTTGGTIGLEPVTQTPSQPGSGTGTGAGSGGSTDRGTANPGTSTAGGTITPAPYVPPSPGAITAAGTIRNDDGGRIYAGGPIELQSANIRNNGGTLSVASLSVNQPTFSNQGGTLNVSNGFTANVDHFDNSAGGKLNAGSLNIRTSGDLVNTDGVLTSATDANLTVGDKAENTRGSISAAGPLTANVTDATFNDGGALASNQALKLNAASLQNTKGSIQSAQAGVQLAVNNQLVNGNGGTIGAATDLNVQAGSLANGGSLRGANDVTVAVAGALTNDGSITAGRNTTVGAGTLASGTSSMLGAGVQSDGKLSAVGDLRVTTSGALVANGKNIAAGNATLQGASVDLSGSQTSAVNVAITATQGNVTTSKATVVTSGTLSVTANAQPGQTLVNQGGKLNASRLDLKVSNIANTQGGEIVQTGTGATRITTSGVIDNSGGTLASNGSLAFTAASLNNKGGTLRAAQTSDLAVTVAGLVDNRRGEMSAGGNTTLQAGSLDNDAGRVTAAGDVSSTTSGATSNKGGTIAANGNTTLNAGSLDNAGGTVSALSTLTANVQGAVDNTTGTLVANQALVLDAGSLVNDNGSVQSTQAATRLNVGGALNNGSGFVGAATDLGIKAGTLANAGNLRAGNDASVAVGGQLANDGNITAGRSTTIKAGSVQSSSKGVLGAGVQSDGKLGTTGDLSVTADGALVAHGTNLAAGNATLQGASVDVSASQTSGANIAVTATQGDVTTSKATVVMPGTLSVTANSNAAQTLVNDAGRLNAGQLDLKLSNLANTNGGEIVQTGAGATTIAMGGTLNNDGGRIASNGQDLTLQAASIGNAAGKIEHAGTGTLKIAGGNFTGTNGQVTTNGALTVAMAGAFKQDGGTTSAKQITIDADSLSNRGGQIVQTGTDATRITVAGILDTTAGTIASNGNTSIAAGNLINQGGAIRATGNASLDVITAGALDNSHKGQISAGGDAKVRAASLQNDAGSLTAVGDLSATVDGAASNVGGILAANGNTAVAAATLDNSTGTVAAVKGNLAVTTSGTTTNVGGTLQAGGTNTLSNGGLDNTTGKIFGNAANVDTHRQQLTNSQGTLASATTLDLQTGALVNDAGLIQSVAAMTVNTNGQALSNTNAAGYTGGQGGITSVDTLTLATGAIDNSAGYIGAKGNLKADTAKVVNANGGVVVSQANATIDTHGATYDNRGGQTQAVSDLTINAASGTIDNTGALIRSLGTTSLSAGTILNTSTQGKDQGIEGQNVALNVGILNNNTGAIRANQNITIASGGNVDNTAGQISALETLSIKDPNAANPSAKTLSIINANGMLIGGTAAVRSPDGKVQTAGFGGVLLDARSFSGNGKLVSLNDLGVALVGDTTNNAVVSANGNLSYATTGNLTNNGKLLAGQVLTVSGNNVDNTVSAEMSANDTTVNAAGTLTNRGLIDSQGETQINAGTATNIGTGRIYGNRISVAAGTLNNTSETVNGAVRAATIASRGNLDLGVQTINNSEHALIFSAGDMFIGGGLDAKRQATTTRGGTLNNLSANIESLGDMSIAMDQINNFDNHFAVTRTSSGPVNGRSTITPLGGVELPADKFVLDRGGRMWSTIVNGQVLTGKGWIERQYTVTTEVDQPANPPDPGRIYAGSSMTIDGKLRNRDSQVMAGGQFNIDPANIDNTPTQGQRIVTESGLQVYVPGEKGNNLVPSFIPEQKSIYNIDVGASCFNDCAGLTPSGRRPNTAQGIAVDDRVGAAGEVTAGTRARAIVEVPSAVGGVIKTNGTTANSAGAVDGASGTTVAQSDTGATNVSANGSAAGTASAARAGATQTIPMVVRTSLPNTTIPSTSLFGIHAGPGGYLIETDPRFANYRNWLSSDYLLNNLGLDPTNILKRLGDGFYEQKLIREQVAQLTGYRYLNGYSNDEDQYTALMNAGVTFSKAYGLRPGIALTPAQMAQLTSDIVWLVEQTVTLPDGSTQRVLVPQVFVRVQPGDITGSGSLLSADRMIIKGKGDLTNSGTIAGRTLVDINADNINNLGGRIAGGSVTLDAKNDLNNIGGSITGANSVSLTAGRDIRIETTTSSQTGLFANKTSIDRVAGVYVSNPGGTLIANAGNDVDVIAGILSNKGAGSFTSITAGKNINLGTVTESDSRLSIFTPTTYQASANLKETGSTIVGDGAVLLNARGGDINARAATLDSGRGLLSLTAAGDVNITSGVEAHATMGASQSTKKGFLKSTTTSISGEAQSTSSIGSRLSGQTIGVLAGRDINMVGSDINAKDDATLIAQRNINIVSAVNSASASLDRTRETKGFIAPKPGGSSIDRGIRNEQSAEVSSQIERASSVTAGGNLYASAGDQVNVYASNLSAGKDLKIEGKEVTILSGTNEFHAKIGSKDSKQSIGTMGNPKRAGKGMNGKESVTNAVDQTTLAAATLSGKNISVTARDGDLTLGAARIKADETVALNAPKGAVNLDVVKTATEVSQSRGESDPMYQRTRDTGAHAEAANYTQIDSPTLKLNTPTVNVQVGQNSIKGPNGIYVAQQTIEQVLATQRDQPGMGWLNQIQNDPAFNKLQINWQGVPLEQRQWAEKQGSLTEAGGAVVAIVATVMTWGAASSIGTVAGSAAGGGATGAVVSAAVSAGVSSIAAQTAVGLINHNGNIAAVLKDLASSRGIKNIATAMVTAGAIQGLSVSGVLPPNIANATNGSAKFVDQLQRQLIDGVASAVVRSAINGTSLEDNLKNGIATALLNTVAAQGADQIGNLRVGGTVNVYGQQVAHTILGCLVGAGRAAASPGSGSASSGCTAGAVGAVIGELTASTFNPSGDPELATQTLQIANLMSGIAGALIGNSASSAYIAAAAGVNAAENNFLLHAQAIAMKDDFANCAKKAGGCSEQDIKAITQKYLDLSSANIDAVNKCITAGDAACVRRLQSEAASAGEVDAAIPVGYGDISRVFQGRQNNVNDYNSVKGAQSLFGSDEQQALDVAKFRQDSCATMSVAACDGMVDQAIKDRYARAGKLMAVGGITGAATAKLVGLRVPTAATTKAPIKTVVADDLPPGFTRGSGGNGRVIGEIDRATGKVTYTDSNLPAPTPAPISATQNPGGQFALPAPPGPTRILPGATPDPNEMRAGLGLAGLGFAVDFQPTAASLGLPGRTADLGVSNGLAQIDVYTPKTATSLEMILQRIENKNDQANGVVVQTDRPLSDVQKIANDTWQSLQAPNIRVLFFQRTDGSIIRIDRPGMQPWKP